MLVLASGDLGGVWVSREAESTTMKTVCRVKPASLTLPYPIPLKPLRKIFLGRH